MKNWLKVIVAVMLVLVCMLSYVACDNNAGDPDTNKPVVDNSVPSEPSNTPGLEELEEGYRVNFYYSYTAVIENNYGRTEEKNERKLAGTVYLPYDNTGWSEAALAAKDAIVYNGYKFEEWYPEWDAATSTGWNTEATPQAPVGDPYAFNTPVTGDINLYASRGLVAGDDITWNIVYEYETEKAAPPEAEEGSFLVTFVNVDKSANITNKTSLLTVSVGASGWTDELKAQKNAVKYNGAPFTAWYTAWDYTTMAPTGDAYAFDTAPAENLVLYGVKGENTSASEVTEVSKVSATLSFVGSGAMYDFGNRTVIDIPWYDYRTDITNVVMDDSITYIGRNAFAGFKALKSIDFADNITKIGAYAFYEASSNYFKVLRLPDGVVEIGENAFAYTNITQLYLGESITTIGPRAFYASNGISYAVVPATLANVGGAAFHPGPGNFMGGNAEHKLAKVYYNPIAADGSVKNFADITVDIENQWFNESPAVYLMNQSEELTEDEKKTAWYPVELDGVIYPAQYSYAIKYTVDGSLLPIVTDYVPATPVKDDAGNYVLNEKGDAIKIEGALVKANIDFKNNLKHPDGYGFYDFNTGSVQFEEGEALTSDLSVLCKRFNTVGSTNTGYLGGGISWSLTNGELVINAAPDDYVGEDKNIAWDLASSAASQTLWNGEITGAVKVTSIKINEGVKYLGNFVFTGTALTEITLPESLIGIASNAFDNCASLHAVYYAGETIPEDVKNLVMVNARAYAKAPASYNGEVGAYWIDDGETRTAWQLDENGALYIGGDSNMKDYVAASEAPWYAAKDKITSLAIASNITKLSKYLVYGYTGINDIKLNPDLKYIPATALEGTGLVNKMNEYKNGMLIIDGILVKVDPARRNHDLFATNTNITVIAGGALARCNNIKSLYISNTIKYINADAFTDSTLLAKAFVDQSANAWAGITADWKYDVTKLQLHYKGDFDGKNGVYTATICNHVYTDWVEHAPTCTEDGYKTRECVFGENCLINKNTAGPVVEEEKTGLLALGHTFENYVANSDGTETATCKNCTETDTRTIVSE